MGMFLLGCLNDERYHAWYQCTFWVVSSWQKFVPSTYVIHSQTSTLFPVYLMMSSNYMQLITNRDASARQFKRWMPWSMVPKHFLGCDKLTKICSKSVRPTQSELQTFLPLQYTCTMAAIVDLLNINGDASASLFERWTPPSMVQMYFLGFEELTKVCSKSVRRTQSELHTFLPLQYTSTMAAIVDLLNIIGEASSRLFEWWTPPSMVTITFLVCEKLTKICSKYVHYTQSDLHTLPCISDDVI